MKQEENQCKSNQIQHLDQHLIMAIMLAVRTALLHAIDQHFLNICIRLDSPVLIKALYTKIWSLEFSGIFIDIDLVSSSLTFVIGQT